MVGFCSWDCTSRDLGGSGGRASGLLFEALLQVGEGGDGKDVLCEEKVEGAGRGGGGGGGMGGRLILRSS